jgi:hypothetical protein
MTLDAHTMMVMMIPLHNEQEIILMALSNAERQARWRAKRDAEFSRMHMSEADDFLRVRNAIRTLNAEIKVEGKKNMATMSPDTVLRLAVLLDRLLTDWPILPLDTKRKIAKAKTSNAVSSLLPNLRAEARPRRVT